MLQREGGIGSRADGHEGREIKWGGYLAGRKNGTRREEEERAVTDSTGRERGTDSFHVFIAMMQDYEKRE